MKDGLLVGLALLLDLRTRLTELPDYVGLLLLVIPLYGLLWVLLRHPARAFIFMWVLATIGPIIEFSPRFGLFLTLYMGACHWPARRADAALASCAIPLGVSFYPTYAFSEGGTPREWSLQLLVGSDVVLWIALAFAAWKWGRLTYVGELRLQETQRLHAALTAQELQAERLRLARELHDNVGHALSAIIMQSAGVRTLVRDEDDQIKHSLNMIQDTGVMAMRDLHGVLGLLRSEDSPALVAEGIRIEDLRTLYHVARASGLTVDTAVTGSPSALSADVEVAAYRVVQECLTNARKHAGHGARVRVELDWGQDRLTVTVRNSPGPLQPSHESPAVDMASLSGGTGLEGLTQRLGLVGGRLHYGPTERGDFCVRAELPTAASHGGWDPAQ